MLQYRLQPVENFRCDYATGADFCDAFVTSTDSSYPRRPSAVSSLLSIRLSKPMPFSRSGPFRGLDAYCKDDELSEIGSQLAEGSINAGTVEPWRNSAFVLLVLAKARPSLSRGVGPSGVHRWIELRMNDGRRVACWDYFVLPQGANAAIRSWLRLPQPLQVQARTGYSAPAD
jgi:hypothetical protein